MTYVTRITIHPIKSSCHSIHHSICHRDNLRDSHNIHHKGKRTQNKKWNKFSSNIPSIFNWNLDCLIHYHVISHSPSHWGQPWCLIHYHSMIQALSNSNWVQTSDQTMVPVGSLKIQYKHGTSIWQKYFASSWEFRMDLRPISTWISMVDESRAPTSRFLKPFDVEACDLWVVWNHCCSLAFGSELFPCVVSMLRSETSCLSTTRWGACVVRLGWSRMRPCHCVWRWVDSIGTPAQTESTTKQEIMWILKRWFGVGAARKRSHCCSPEVTAGLLAFAIGCDVIHGTPWRIGSTRNVSQVDWNGFSIQAGVKKENAE